MIDPHSPDYENTPASARRARFPYAPQDPEAAPYVSIVTPFYNTGTVFHETASTVFGQSFQQWEWLIVNDGSNDPVSLEILDQYRGRDRRVHIIDRPANEGPSAARNAGFALANAEYVLQLDSDNLLEPTALEKWLWFLESFPEYSFVKGFSVGFGAGKYLWSNGFHKNDAFLEANQVDTTSLIRRSVHAAVGGYDETIRKGLEDWEFWLRCANAGFWGGTVPEYLDWYRRRSNHSERWSDWDEGPAQAAFHAMLRQRYPRLWEGNFPRISPRPHEPSATLSHALPFHNRLAKEKPRLLLIVPWLTVGGADKFNLDLIPQLKRRGWEISIATTLPGDHSWLPVFSGETPDVFVLNRFLHLTDYPRFLRYLIQSRQIDAVCISHSELAYLLLPYLRAHCPDTVFLDFCHIDEPYWKNGGYPNMAVENHELLDLHVVASRHLKNWMVNRGASPERVSVCYINVDPGQWRPDARRRERVRRDLGLGKEEPLIFYAARLCDQKQPGVFAGTVATLHKRGVVFTALVAGNGPDFSRLARFVSTEKLDDRVKLLGVVSPDRMKELMAAADVFFLPSHWEGIALTLYEAMAAAVPVVTADVGGQKELITPDCGVLIPKGSEEAEIEMYTAALADLLTNPQKRARMGAAGRQRVATHFTIDEMGEVMHRCLQEAQRFHRQHRRPIPATGLAHACASLAIEYTRMARVADELWNSRGNHALAVSPGAHLYELLRVFEPAFNWAVQRGLHWLIPIKNRAKARLLNPG